MLNGISVGGFIYKLSVNKMNGVFYSVESFEDEY